MKPRPESSRRQYYQNMSIGGGGQRVIENRLTIIIIHTIHSMPARAAVARRHELEIRARYRNLWKQVPSYPWPRGAVRILHVKAKTELPGMTIENGIDSRKIVQKS